jgi:hypothetical protein
MQVIKCGPYTLQLEIDGTSGAEDRARPSKAGEGCILLCPEGGLWMHWKVIGGPDCGADAHDEGASDLIPCILKALQR